ncbi:aminopeptidase P family protein [Lachnospiraceae bacterium C1.1]|nr:aminopeptidase P family protein [Lachnospiraceae bacterium C1.1]
MQPDLIRERLRSLRDTMREERVSAYYINTADFHNSEYVNDYFKVREFFSGFTGSNGSLVVMQDEAGLWTDGRYFVQAERELKGSGIDLYRMGEEGVPTIEEFIADKLGEGDVFAFDGRTVTAARGKSFRKIAKKKGFSLEIKKDLSSGIFERPAFPVSKAEVLADTLVGESASAKLKRLRKRLSKEGADSIFISSLDDIMWLFNIRGNDVEYNPVLMSYAYVAKDAAYLFIQNDAVTDELKAAMEKAAVMIRDYNETDKFLKNLKLDDAAVVLDSNQVNYIFYKRIKKKADIIELRNPTTEMKAVKNDCERSNMRRIFLKDSVQLTRFIRWVVENIGKEPMTEMSVSDRLEEFRREIPEFRDLSFNTISAYGANAAMMHYAPSNENPVELKAEHMLLVDSGGQYNGGTTDVTRTIVLGELTEEERKCFTLTACSMLNLLNARFLYGCTGRNVDILARARMWNEGMDYKCGTGHGVGYILNVHEGPQNIRWKAVENEAVLEEGMDVSDEPGVYKAGKFGIRTENILLVKKGIHTDDGQFMEFENLTMVPIDDRGIDRSIMTERELSEYISYQTEVCAALKDSLSEEEYNWVRKYAGIA